MLLESHLILRVLLKRKHEAIFPYSLFKTKNSINAIQEVLDITLDASCNCGFLKLYS